MNLLKPPDEVNKDKIVKQRVESIKRTIFENSDESKGSTSSLMTESDISSENSKSQSDQGSDKGSGGMADLGSKSSSEGIMDQISH